MAYTETQKRAHIHELQRFLHGISYHDNRIPRILPDGIYGPETANAVRAFQDVYGLTPNGETNLTTWNRLAAVYQELVETIAEALEVFPLEANAVIGRRSSGFVVRIVQAILQSLSERYHNLPEVEVSGIYGDATEEAVRQFQALAVLPQTGTVDIRTWNALVAAVASFPS